jgi:hypothetical protein
MQAIKEQVDRAEVVGVVDVDEKQGVILQIPMVFLLLR